MKDFARRRAAGLCSGGGGKSCGECAEDGREREAPRQRHADAPRALTDVSGDLEKSQAHGIELPLREGGREWDELVTKRIEETIGEGVQQEAKGVGHVGGARETVARERTLEVLDAIFGVPPTTVPVFIQKARRDVVEGW